MDFSFNELNAGSAPKVGGRIDRLKEVTDEMEIDPHTINISPMIHGQTGLLSAP